MRVCTAKCLLKDVIDFQVVRALSCPAARPGSISALNWNLSDVCRCEALCRPELSTPNSLSSLLTPNSKYRFSSIMRSGAVQRIARARSSRHRRDFRRKNSILISVGESRGGVKKSALRHVRQWQDGRPRELWIWWIYGSNKRRGGHWLSMRRGSWPPGALLRRCWYLVLPTIQVSWVGHNELVNAQITLIFSQKPSRKRMGRLY